MKKLLIVGVAGFVGKHLVEEFSDNGYSVYGCDIYEKPKPLGIVKYFNVDILNKEQIKAVVYEIQPDIIVNLAAISSVGISWSVPQKTILVNVIGVLNILEVVRAAGIRPTILLVGSSEEYGASVDPVDEKSPLDANNPYGISKIAQENFARLYQQRYGMKICCVRAFNHIGIGQSENFAIPSFCKQVAQIEKSGMPGVIRAGNLAVQRDFSSVKDVVRAYRMIVEKGSYGKIYNVGSGKTYSLRELLDYIISLCSQEIVVEIDPGRFRPADISRICCDNTLIKRELGWMQKFDIYDTLREMFEEYLK